MKANAAIFDLYTAGTGFSSVNSRDGFLTEISAGSKVPLVLANSMIWNDADGGLLRIQAPEIQFRNQTLSADTIEIGASGPIILSVDAPILNALKGFKDEYDVEKNGANDPARLSTILSNARNLPVPLPLGFDGPESLAIQAFNVSIRSTGKPISITGVPIHTNDLTITTGSVAKFIAERDVSILENSTSVKLTSTDGVSLGQSVTGVGIPDGTLVDAVNTDESTITLSNAVTTTGTVTVTIGNGSAAQADGSVTLSNVVLNSLQGTNPLATPQSFAVHALGDLTITDSDFSYATSIDLRTNLNAMLTSTKFQDIEDLSVWADQDITFEAVSITGDQMSQTSSVSATSNQGNVYLNSSKTNSSFETELLTDVAGKTVKVPAYTTKTVMVAKKVNFTANNGDIVINSYEFRGDGNGTQEFSAKAKNIVGVYNTSLTDAAKVSLAANTVVLRDVNFADGADVALRSQTGLVAALPGTGQQVAMGKVNFVSGVYYGPHEINLPAMATPQGDAGFRTALSNKYPGQNFSKLTITDLNKQTK